MGAESGLDVLHIGHVGVGFQITLSCRRRLTAFSSRSAMTPTKSRIVTRQPILEYRAPKLIDRDQARADKIAGIDAGVGRRTTPAMEHAGTPARRERKPVRRCAFAGKSVRAPIGDNGVGIDGLYRNIISQFQADFLAGDQFAVADAAVIASADQAVLYREVFHGIFESFGGPPRSGIAGLCRRVA